MSNPHHEGPRRKAEGLAAWQGRFVEVRGAMGAVFRGKFVGVIDNMIIVRKANDRDVLVPLAFVTAVLDEDSHVSVALEQGEDV